jgi:hypothetical protein
MITSTVATLTYLLLLVLVTRKTLLDNLLRVHKLDPWAHMLLLF